MKFGTFKEFRGLVNATLLETVDYLRTDLKKFLRELQVGLSNLSFQDNFKAFIVEATIPAMSEMSFVNQFRDGSIPTQRIIVRGGSGVSSIVDGDTAWDKNFVWLKNTSASTVSATILFIK